MDEGISFEQFEEFKNESIAKIDYLLQENDVLNTALKAKEDDVRAVAIEYQSVKKNLDSLQQAHKKLAVENEEIKYELAILLRQKSVFETERNELAKKNTAAEEKIKKLESDMQDLLRVVSSKDKGIANFQQETMSLAKQVLETKGLKLNEDLENLEEMRKGFHGYIDELQKKEAVIMGLRDENARQSQLITSLQKDIANQNFQHSVLYEKFEALRESEQKLLKEVDYLHDKNQTETVDYRKELKACHERLAELRLLIQRMDFSAVPQADSEEKIILMEQLHSFERKEVEHLDMIDNLREKVSELEGVLKILYDEYCVTLTKLNSFQPAVSDIKGLQMKTIDVMIAALKTDESQKKRELSLIEDNNKILEKKLQEAHRELSELKKQNEQLKFNQERNQMESNRQSIDANPSFGHVQYHHSGELYQLRRENEHLRQRLDGPNGEVAQLRAQIVEIEKSRDEGLEGIRKEIKEFSMNKQQALEKERLALLVRCVEAEEQLQELQQYLNTSITRYQRDIVELKAQLEVARAGTPKALLNDMWTQTTFELAPLQRPSAPLRRGDCDILHVQHQDPGTFGSGYTNEQYSYPQAEIPRQMPERRRLPSPQRRIRSAENNHGLNPNPYNPNQVDAWRGY